MARRSKEEIDEIMEEMEAATPRSSVNFSFNEPQANSTIKISDDVDAKRDSDNDASTSNFFSKIFEPKPVRPGLKYPSKLTDEKYYDYTNSRIGFALIFNQVQFKDENERKGSTKDANDLYNVLADLGFDVKILTDSSTSRIREVLKAVSNYDHSDNDCLLITIMTHGKKDGIIYSADGELMVNELWENFIGVNCPSLIGKPKLFFIQACRGSMTDPGILLKPKAKTRTLTKPTDTVDAKALREEHYVIPTLADLLVMYSTSEGYYSFRNPSDGSWFIQALCAEIEENSHEEIMTILTGVNRRVAFGKQSHVPEKPEWDASKQMPIIQSMLTKSLYFLKREQKEKMNL